jgi:protocatechuate 3,4-dioxygenase beta subunit
MVKLALALLSLFAACEVMAGSITGQVVSNTGGAPIADVRMSVCISVANCFATTQTDTEGRYRFDGLAARGYHVAAVKLPYVTQFYDGVECPCDPNFTSPTIIPVTADGETSGIDLTLTLGGTISGTVRRASTNEKLDGVTIVTQSATRAFRTLSFNVGQYKSTALPPGEYRVYTLSRESTHVINQIHPGRNCTVRAICDQSELAQAQLVTVTAGNDAPGIDFALLDWATVSGTVRKSDGTPVPFKWVDLRDEPNYEYGSTTTDANGAYVRAMPPGSYMVSMQPGEGYAGATRGPVRLMADPVSGIDLVLPVTTTRMEGTIRDRNGVPFPGVEVSAIIPSGYYLRTTTTDANGRYAMENMTPGRYYLRAIDELHPNVDCLSGPCTNLNGATPFDLVAGVTTTADMQVRSQRSVFTGRATKGTAGGPPVKLTGISVFSEAGQFVNVVNPFQSSADGTYSLTIVSRVNAFYLRAYAESVTSTIYPDVPADCGYGIFCSAPGAVAVAAGTRSGVDFVMTAYGAISGTVYDKSTGQPVPGSPVNFARNGVFIAQAVTDVQGRYRWAQAYGAYQVYVPEWLNKRYAGQVYPNRDCSGPCDPKSGTPVSVASGGETAGIDFQLTPIVNYGRISGTVRDATSGKAIAGAPVRFAWNGTDVHATTTDASGNYRWTGANGSYHVYVPQWGSHAYWGQVYRDRDCNGVCDSRMGTVVTATDGAEKTKIDFQLTPAAQTARITGRVVDDETGEGVEDALVRAWSTTFAIETLTDSLGNYTIEKDGAQQLLPTGDYRVLAVTAPYFTSVYGGEQCPDYPSCDVASGAVVHVAPATTTSGIDFRLIRMEAAAVTPATGPVAGGTWITITGKHFASGATVRIGTADAEVVSVTPTSIVAITPPGLAGAADVTVRLTANHSATIPNGFVYTPGSSRRRSARH